MRAIDCPCGEHLEERNDEQLTEAVRRHAEAEHPDRYDDAEIRALVATSAYDAGD